MESYHVVFLSLLVLCAVVVILGETFKYLQRKEYAEKKKQAEIDAAGIELGDVFLKYADDNTKNPFKVSYWVVRDIVTNTDGARWFRLEEVVLVYDKSDPNKVIGYRMYYMHVSTLSADLTVDALQMAGKFFLKFKHTEIGRTNIRE